jgi:ABC-type lipoprotein release transport system permease subunit
VVINARLARRFFGDVSPVGQRMTVGKAPVREIVGVIPDAKHYGLKEAEWPMVFLPTASDGSFLVRTTQELSAQTIRSVAAAGIAQVEHIRSFEDDLQSGLDKEKLMAALCTVFAGLATLLAGLGLYGVLAYSVSRRTAELGIRMALGAQRRDVEWLVMRDTAWMIAAGVVAGVSGAYAASRLVATMLFGIRVAEPAVYGLAALVLAAVAALAGWLPARRASRVDPMIALRYE